MEAVFTKIKPMEFKDTSRFFEFGEISFEERDFQSRSACIKMCLPNCLYQAIMPSLLESGQIDKLAIRSPIAVWIPKLSESRITRSTLESIDNALPQINKAMVNAVGTPTQMFQRLSTLVNDPADLICILPLGTYVTLRFRCCIDNIPKVLFGIENTPIIGIQEFQFALSEVLACILNDIQNWEKSNLLLEASKHR